MVVPARAATTRSEISAHRLSAVVGSYIYMASGDPHVLVNLGLASQCHKTLNRGAFQQNAVNGDFTTLVPVQMWTCAPANGTVKKAARTKKVAVK